MFTPLLWHSSVSRLVQASRRWQPRTRRCVRVMSKRVQRECFLSGNNWVALWKSVSRLEYRWACRPLYWNLLLVVAESPRTGCVKLWFFRTVFWWGWGDLLGGNSSRRSRVVWLQPHMFEAKVRAFCTVHWALYYSWLEHVSDGQFCNTWFQLIENSTANADCEDCLLSTLQLATNSPFESDDDQLRNLFVSLTSSCSKTAFPITSPTSFVFISS